MQRSLTELAIGASTYLKELATSANADYRATLLLNEYRSRRRHYEASARSMRLVYDDSQVDLKTRQRLEHTGLNREKRPRGTVHTLAFFPLHGWHSQLLKPLAALGPLSHFDSRMHGYSYSDLFAGRPAAIDHRRRICESFERFAARAVAKRPVDWIFVYASGAELLVSTIEKVKSLTRAPVVGMCLDDKQSWSGPLVGGQDSGQIALVPHLDLGWTSSRVACEWYMVEGGNPIYMPEGCDPDLYSPDATIQDLDACFVGQAYGFRRAFVARLRQLGLDVRTWGPGWPAGPVSDDELVRIFRRSKIVLGHGGIGWSEELKNTKGRDFDAPAVGMGPYLTSYSPELTEFFTMGREILSYSCADECYEVAMRTLRDENFRLEVARAGRDCCLRKHTWIQRFERALTALGVL